MVRRGWSTSTWTRSSIASSTTRWWRGSRDGSLTSKVLKLLRRYLEAGVMAGGVRQQVEEGTRQGSPLSPLLGVLLDDLEGELERRGHRFVRYADDLMVYVRSERAGVSWTAPRGTSSGG
jgi:retron-type reverse transcriptase